MDDVQHALQGRDPAVVGPEWSKTTEVGEFGSYGAVFGLTSDGQRH